MVEQVGQNYIHNILNPFQYSILDCGTYSTLQIIRKHIGTSPIKQLTGLKV